MSVRKTVLAIASLLLSGCGGPGKTEIPVKPDPPKLTVSAKADFDSYKKGLTDAKVSRKGDDPGLTELNSQIEPVNADSMIEYKKTNYKKTIDMSKLVMMDTTVGAVFPGALLWAAHVREGRLHQLNQIPHRPPVTVTFTGMHEVPAELSRTAIVSPSSASAGDTNRQVSFEYDGTYHNFEEKGRLILQQNIAPSTKLVASFAVRQSLKDALLSNQLSAKYWEATMSGGLESIHKENQVVAIMTLDQVNFSASADAPPLDGYLPDQLVQSNADLAHMLASGMASGGGEPVYVRKVDYGRRVIVSLTSSASEEDLKDALNVAVSAFGNSANYTFTEKQLKTFKSVEGKLVIIGGTYPDGINGFFGGDLHEFVKTIRAIMDKPNVDDAQKGAVPVSFELAYVDDNAPMQVYETQEFAGKIPVAGKENVHEKIGTTGSDAAVIREDDEINSDDSTLVQLVSQRLRVSPDRLTVYFDLEWQACEGDEGKVITGKKTVIRSTRTFSHVFTKPVKSIVSEATFGTFDQWYEGKRHDTSSFKNCGLLSNIRVRFDGKGRKDHLLQTLDADLDYTVWLEK